MKDSPGKSKSTLESPLNENRVITGEKLIERDRLVKKEARKKRAPLEGAIELEQRIRRMIAKE